MEICAHFANSNFQRFFYKIVLTATIDVQKVGAGAEQKVGAGADQKVGAGADQKVGAGADQKVLAPARQQPCFCILTYLLLFMFTYVA